MKYNPNIHRRRSIRLKGYDYSKDGVYFITLCSQNRECLFGDIVSGQMRLNTEGKIVEKYWNQLNDRFPGVETDMFVVMPNHFHGIIFINDRVGAGILPPTIECKWTPPRILETPVSKLRTAPHLRAGGSPPLRKYNLGHVVAYFKYQTTKFVVFENKSMPSRIWQRNYHEHIIRDDDELNRIREYVFQNPMKWEMDRENPNAFVPELASPWELHIISTNP
jgi:REP element-mobilizing transposase RayT